MQALKYSIMSLLFFHEWIREIKKHPKGKPSGCLAMMEGIEVTFT